MKWQFLNSRKASQAIKRGWTGNDVQAVLDNPAETQAGIDASTGNSATVYYREDGRYVVCNDITGNVFQVSDTRDANWIDPFDEVIRPRGGSR